MLSTTPFFHLMGLMSLIFTVWFDVPVLIGPEKPLSVEHMVDLLRVGRPTAAICPPSVLEDMSYSDDALACLKNVKSVLFGGAPLAPNVGDRLRQHTRVVSVIGTSEAGWIASMAPEDPANWGYFEWNDAYGIDMQDNGDSMFEMVIPRQPDARDFKGIFHTYPDISVYHTNDLYTRHPTHPRLWKFHGRKDDVIVLSNGEKFNPVGMETIIEGHPLVGSAVVVGQSRFQAALLIELNQDVPEMDTKLFLEQIWPTVQVANQTIAAHGRVMKNRIGIASKTKPFKKTPKGTVQRRSVLRDFEKEIDAIYTQSLDDEFDRDLPENLDSESVLKYVRQTIAHVLEKEIAPTQDFYGAGLDSLMTIQVSRMLQKIVDLRPELKAVITAQTIYANPTIDQLSTVVTAMLDGKSQAEIPREDKIHNLVEKYTSDLPARKAHHNELQSPTTVILTGSTGSIARTPHHDKRRASKRRASS
jgi:aryl carrier-like protein